MLIKTVKTNVFAYINNLIKYENVARKEAGKKRESVVIIGFFSTEKKTEHIQTEQFILGKKSILKDKKYIWKKMDFWLKNWNIKFVLMNFFPGASYIYIYEHENISKKLKL